jgi:hypothetical protein
MLDGALLDNFFLRGDKRLRIFNDKRVQINDDKFYKIKVNGK